jgi:hypothetical protein
MCMQRKCKGETGRDGLRIASVGFIAIRVDCGFWSMTPRVSFLDTLGARQAATALAKLRSTGDRHEHERGCGPEAGIDYAGCGV